MSQGDARTINYDRLAEGYDRRYELYRYDGVLETLRHFIGSERPAVLEVGCGTGHWLAAIASDAGEVVGLEPSLPMIARARVAAPNARLARGRAEQLPWRDATFDRIFCINALHHFADRLTFFAEAHRVLKSGGALLTVGKDPHTGSDCWWLYDYFPEAREIDRKRFAPVRALRGELTNAGFRWAESFEADQINAVTTAAQALAGGIVERSFTSQLAALTDDELRRGVKRIRDADLEAGGQLQLVSDFQLFATIGWKGQG